MNVNGHMPLLWVLEDTRGMMETKTERVGAEERVGSRAVVEVVVAGGAQ